MIKQRSKSSIDALILAAASHRSLGVNKAKLARDLVIPYAKLNTHCDRLVDRELLLYNPVTRTYETTRKGEEMVQLTEDLACHYSPFDQMFSKYKLRIESGSLGSDGKGATRFVTDPQQGGKLGAFALGSLMTFEQFSSNLTSVMVNALPY